MTTRTVHLISNPNAGQNQSRRAAAVARFCALLRERGVAVEVLHTTAPGDATRLAAEAARGGAREIIASGGDGTVNEVLQALVETDVRLGVWPSGTANVLARELGLPFDLPGICDVIARGATRRIYLGCATEERTSVRRYFCLMAGVGLDASVVAGVRPRLKRRVGKGAFWVSGLSHLAYWRPVPFNVEVDGETYAATFAAIGKTAHYGGELAVTPRAHLECPEFEICLVSSHSRLRYLHLLTHAMRRDGVTRPIPGVRFIRTTRARATGTSPVQVDGELIGQLPMTFEIVPAPIEVLAPVRS
ncbi:MAG TPA: diacylglycerol kinase family protein [Pyrinomonadaceae bacterium]|jgi:YegS/Rv2252/BmrU family lipid kinase